MSLRYLTPASLSRISFNEGPHCTGLISALFSGWVQAQAYFTIALRTRPKVLYHSTVSSTPSEIIMCSFCSKSSFSLRGSWRAYAILLGVPGMAVYLPFTCKLTVPSKHPIPEKHCWTHCVIFALIPGMLFCLLLCWCWTWNNLAHLY